MQLPLGWRLWQIPGYVLSEIPSVHLYGPQRSQQHPNSKDWLPVCTSEWPQLSNTLQSQSCGCSLGLLKVVLHFKFSHTEVWVLPPHSYQFIFRHLADLSPAKFLPERYRYVPCREQTERHKVHLSPLAVVLPFCNHTGTEENSNFFKKAESERTGTCFQLLRVINTLPTTANKYINSDLAGRNIKGPLENLQFRHTKQ